MTLFHTNSFFSFYAIDSKQFQIPEEVVSGAIGKQHCKIWKNTIFQISRNLLMAARLGPGTALLQGGITAEQ
ncbi:hypothetical protein ACHAXS_012011 [Conticribra weissflogii]